MIKINLNKKYCECGCGQLTKMGKYGRKRFICNHHKLKSPYKLKSPPQLCLCGCGKLTTLGSKYIYGHNNKGKKFSEEIKNKLKESAKNRPCQSEVTRRKKSDTLKQAYRDGRIVSALKGIPNTEQMKRKNSIKKMGNSWNKGISHSKERIQKRIIGIKRSWQVLSPEEKAKRIYKTVSKSGQHPNKPETFILNLLNKLYPNEWKFTGDFSFTINGKNPDFTNINGQKKLIELFGDYWHKGEDPNDRINVFKPFGWDTLVIWECELKNTKQLKRKIFDFCEGKYTVELTGEIL